MTPRRWFHFLLGAIFIPFLSLPLVWGVAIYSLRRAVELDARRWARRILGLALVDTIIVVIIVGFSFASDDASIKAHSTAVPDRVVIGVKFDLSFSGAGVRVRDLAPGSPAAAAGLESGDIIVRFAGEEISGPDALRTVVARQQPGVPVSVVVTRGPSTSALSMTPQWSSRIPRAKVGLFDPVERQQACFGPVNTPALLPWAIILTAFAGLGVLVARRGSVGGSARGVWWTALSLVGAGVASYAAAAGACVFLGGPTAAGAAFGLWGSSLALAGTALAGWRLVRNRQTSTPTRAWTSAVALGGWYMITGGVRVVVFTWAAMQLAPGRVTISANPIESLGQGLATMEGPGLLLLAVPAVLLAPIGEELAFRGLLQPALGGWLKPPATVALTSLLFASMHWYYGVKLPLVFFIGVVLGWSRIVSGGLRAPIALHALVNAAGFLATFLRGALPG